MWPIPRSTCSYCAGPVWQIHGATDDTSSGASPLDWGAARWIFLAFAGVDSRISLHSLRRYSINRLAKHNLLAAQQIAGHKDTKTTLIYTKIDPDYVREAHAQVGVVRGIVSNRNYEKQKRKRLV